MREHSIQINPFEFITLKKLTISHEVGTHGSATVEGFISSDNVDLYQPLLLSENPVTIMAITESNQSLPLMVGVVSSFDLNVNHRTPHLSLTIKTETYRMDGINHFRTFQNKTASFKEIMTAINETYSDAFAIFEEATNQPTNRLFLQYNETDWQFLKRVASSLSLCITPSGALEGINYYVGQLKNRKHHTLSRSVSYSVTKHLDTFMKQSSNGQGSLTEGAYLEYKIQSRDIYKLWDQLSFDGGSGYIYKIDSNYIGEELLHTYYLRPLHGLKTTPCFNHEPSGCSFEAVVCGVKADVVQIELLNDEYGNQEAKTWFPFSTVYSSSSGPGWYCMPEIGDSVRLYIPNEFEDGAYVMSAVHKETSNDRNNPDHKSIKTKYGKELLMTPESIVFTNNKGMKIEISDNEGINIISNKDILIKSANNVTISSEDASLMIAGTSSVDVVQAGASIHMDDDITFTGAKFRIQ